MKKTWLILVVAVFMQTGSLAFASDDKFSRKTLKGLKGFYVIVEIFQPEIKKKKLISQQIKTDVELKLRLAGIKVLTQDEGHKGRPWLYMKVVVRKLTITRVSFYFYVLDIKLIQEVFLARDFESKGKLGQPDLASTWGASVTGSEHNINNIRNHIKDLTDIFINAYLSVNPK